MTDTTVHASAVPVSYVTDPTRIAAMLADELGVRASQVAATVELLDGGGRARDVLGVGVAHQRERQRLLFAEGAELRFRIGGNSYDSVSCSAKRGEVVPEIAGFGCAARCRCCGIEVDDDILAGEVLWAITRACIYGGCFFVVLALFGLTPFPSSLWALLVIPLTGLLFAAIVPYVMIWATWFLPYLLTT